MSQAEYYEGHTDGNNSVESFADLGTVTIYFKSGTDTATSRYVPPKNHGLTGSDASAANGFIVTPDKTIQVKGINGATWKGPKTVVADTNFGLSKGVKKISSVTIEILSTNTAVNVLVTG